MRQRKTWIGVLALAATLMGVAIGFSGCMSFQMKEEEIVRHFEERGQALPQFARHEDEEGSIFVAWTGSGELPSVVFVHGSPGSWDNFIHMLSDASLKSRYTVAAVDRPGFGRSLPRRPEPSIATQARRIRNAVAESGVPLPAIWVGHSLGGPVIARLAIDYPEAVAGLALVAPSMDPELEKRRWFNWAAKFPLVKWGLSREWRNSNEEIFPHRSELEELAPRLSEIRAPTIVIQGDKDELVDPANADFVKKAMTEAVVETRILEGANHFIPWTRPEEIVMAVDALAAMRDAAGAGE